MVTGDTVYFLNTTGLICRAKLSGTGNIVALLTNKKGNDFTVAKDRVYKKPEDLTKSLLDSFHDAVGKLEKENNIIDRR